MGKTQNLKDAYAAIKAGHTIKCNSCTIYIYTKDCYGAPDDGVTYIGWNCFGSSSHRLGIQNLRWIMKEIANSSDYSFTIV